MSSQDKPKFSPRSKSTSTFDSPSSDSICSPISFDAPKDLSGCSPTCPSGYIGSNTSFFINAVFSSSAPASCDQCVYRQLVKGHFLGVKTDGTEVYFSIEVAPGVFVNDSTYQEDGELDAGVWKRYGHREDPSGIWHPLGDTYTPDPRTTGCTYSGKDAPALCADGSVFEFFEMSLHFQGQICQVPCDPPAFSPPGNNTILANNWDVYCSNIP